MRASKGEGVGALRVGNGVRERASSVGRMMVHGACRWDPRARCQNRRVCHVARAGALRGSCGCCHGTACSTLCNMHDNRRHECLRARSGRAQVAAHSRLEASWLNRSIHAESRAISNTRYQIVC